MHHTVRATLRRLATIAWQCSCGYTNLPWASVCTSCGGR